MMQALAQNGMISILLCSCLCLRCTCKLGLRKHKHKRKERKLKNTDKLSAYFLVTRVLPFSAMLESNLLPKGSPAVRLHQIFMLLRLRTSPFAYANRTCKHPCVYACAYACIVRVNQALSLKLPSKPTVHFWTIFQPWASYSDTPAAWTSVVMNS